MKLLMLVNYRLAKANIWFIVHLAFLAGFATYWPGQRIPIRRFASLMYLATKVMIF